MQIPIESLSAETLRRVVEEFVTREGTDYGVSSSDFPTKVEQVLRQLKKGQALLVFDKESESCHIVSKDQSPLGLMPDRKNGPHREDESRSGFISES